MNISWRDVKASDNFFTGVQDSLAEQVLDLRNRSQAVRYLAMPLAALPAGVAFVVLGVAKAVSHIAEAVFKGVVNLVASPFDWSHFDFKRAFVFLGGETLGGAAGLVQDIAMAAMFVGVTFYTAYAA